MIGQIISDPQTANWVIAVLLALLVYFLTKLLNRFERTFEDHEERIVKLENPKPQK